MYSNIDINHPSVKTFIALHKDMKDLCKPLNSIGIDYLSYTRVYKDGARIALSTEPKIIENHFSSKKYLSVENEQHPDIHQSEEVIIWATLPNQDIYCEAREMGACDGIYLFGEKNDDYGESFGLGVSKPNYSILNSYFNHLDLLKKFIYYFHKTATETLKTASKNKIILPFNQNLHKNFIYDSKKLENLFLQNYRIKLTSRQLECAYLLLQGNSMKRIAKELNLSHRTVEAYINHMKTRLQCRNKIELLVKLIEFFKLHKE